MIPISDAKPMTQSVSCAKQRERMQKARIGANECLQLTGLCMNAACSGTVGA